MEAWWFGFRSARWCELSVSGRLRTRRVGCPRVRCVAVRFEPVDPAERRQLDVVDDPPGRSPVDQLGLAEPVDRLLSSR